MSFKLEDLSYQRRAIDSIVRVFDGQQRNFFSQVFAGDVHANYLSLTNEEIAANKRQILFDNGLDEEVAQLSSEPDFCVEMETGTGKTLVYLRTVYELSRAYGFSKFIILVPSVPVREGVLNTIRSFESQLERLYGVSLHAFEYDSRKLTRLRHFIGGTDLQVMVMTVQSFISDDRIINQTGRDDSLDGLSYWQALGRVRPIVIMDEPQEGMDTENLVPRIAELNSFARLRYSATHKVVRNLLYRLSPYDAYTDRLVKKIEVLSVAEKNDEATLKLELAEIQTGKGDPKAKFLAWRQAAGGFRYKPTKWLKSGDNLADATGNISYRDFTVEHIRAAGIRTPGDTVRFSNGVEMSSRTKTGDFEGIFRQQLYWLCYRHFQKTDQLRPFRIKPLSLVFIDRVSNYMADDGIIRRLFREEFPKAFRDHYQKDPPTGLVEDVQGYYFAKTGQGEFTDSEAAMAKNREIFDEILRDKEALLSLDNPRQFIFSHSALGVGWDNPNVFTIATLNQTYSDTKKRQEIGRGLRICVNADGERIYDSPATPEGDEINLLTIIPNETYETFVTQYQSEIGGAITPRHLHKGRPRNRKQVKLSRKAIESERFRRFWEKLARRTDYAVRFDEEELVAKCAAALNSISVPRYEVEAVLTRIDALAAGSAQSTEIGRETARLDARFAPLDLIEELSDKTRLAYPTVISIASRLENLDQLVRNPPRYLHEAAQRIARIEIEEMIRTIDYRPTGETYGIDLFKDLIETYRETVPTPKRGLYDHAILDSASMPERNFASDADADDRVVCVLKLPDWYKIPTPVGNYTPDFGLVIRHTGIRDQRETEIHLVVETKSTNLLEELGREEQIKILCAIRHFEALGISANASLVYKAPAKDLTAAISERAEPYDGKETAAGFFGPRSSFSETIDQAVRSD